MSQTTTDRAAQIRMSLKAKGWSSRDVSVKSDYYSMGSAIRVTIKNPAVSAAVVEGIAAQHEDISRDQWGDILSGGNRYVTVTYSREAEAALTASKLEAVEAAIVALSACNDSALVDVAGTPYMLGHGQHRGYGFSVWLRNKGHQVQVMDARGAAFQIAAGCAKAAR